MSRFGSYQLVRRLGVGGMAEVFLAEAAAGEAEVRRVVVKRLLPHLEDRPHFVRMFLDEAQLTSRLSHPNIVRIDGFGEAEGVHYIAMEFVDGLSLGALLRRLQGARLEFDVACHIVAEACAALAYAHDERDAEGRPLSVVHRDVSPDNILLSRAGQVKLADFGIAKATTQIARTLPGQLKGKRMYMSPEQAMRRDDVDWRSDIFSAGVVLYELALGQRLFSAPSDAVLLQQILHGDYPPPFPERFPEPLAEVLRRALRKDPAERYQGADEMRVALLRLVDDPAAAAARLAGLVGQQSVLGQPAPSARDVRPTVVGGGTAPGLAPGAPAPAAGKPGSLGGLAAIDTVQGYSDTERNPVVLDARATDELDGAETLRRIAAVATPAGDDEDGPPPVRAGDPPTYEIRWARLAWDPRALWRDDARRRVLWAAAAIGVAAIVLLIGAVSC